MGVSLYKIAEKCKERLSSGDLQVLVDTVIDVYSTVVKNEWYENKADGVSEVDGAFIYTFGKSKELKSEKDEITGLYYIIVPSSYLRLPHEMGVNQVSFLKDQDHFFVRVGSGSNGMWSNLKSNVFGGRQTYYIEGNKMVFPKMNEVSSMLLKMAIALDEVDVLEDLNIPRSLVDKIVDLVVLKYNPKPPAETKALV